MAFSRNVPCCVQRLQKTHRILSVILIAVALCCPAALAEVTPSYERPDTEAANCRCKFPKHHDDDKKLMTLLRPLCGKRYTAEDDDNDGYTFTVGICTAAQLSPLLEHQKTGALQTHKPGSSDKTQRNIGSFEKAEIMAGTNWMMLEYEGGEDFHSYCSQEGKRTIIMISCKPGETVGQFHWVEENNNKSADCYYLFELEHEAACTPTPDPGLSAGSVICIIIACTVAVYLIGGFLFMRCVRGAKGMNQIPNYSFWKDFGALQADGCDLICRCGSQSADSRGNYHGIGDHQIECPTDNEEYDERLLPM